MNDNIALVLPRPMDDRKYNLKTFNKLNDAANKAIEYYSEQTEIADGGNIVLEYLYGSDTHSEPSKNTYVLIIEVGAVCLVASLVMIRHLVLKKGEQ